MKIKYAIFNLQTSELERRDTKDEILEIFWNNIQHMARSYCYGTPYTLVDQNGDGSEQWHTNNDCCAEIDKLPTTQDIEVLLNRADPLNENQP